MSPAPSLHLTPVYTTPCASDPIQLYSGPMELRQGAYVGAGDGVVTLHWRVLGPEIRFDIPSLLPVDHLALDNCTVTASSVQGSIAAGLSNVNIGSGPGGSALGVGGYPQHNIVAGIDQSVTRVLFHVVNFWRCFNPRPDPAPSDYDINRVVFEGGGWRVTLEGVNGLDQLHTQVQRESGFGITHIGQVARVDGLPFSRVEAHQLFHALRAFLSFVRGKWSSPILYVGLDACGTPVWEDWTTRTASPGRDVFTWFPELGAGCLGAVFPGFMNLWQNAATREILEVAIHWYVEANMASGAIEGALILAQTGLERLAYYIMVHDRCRLSEPDFKPGGLPAAERLRRLFSEFGLPCNISPALRIGALPAIAASRGWKDAPDAFVRIRNCIVHPDQKNLLSLQTISDEARGDAWLLCLWYYEVILLKWCDYSGAYVNRLTVAATGITEPIP